MISARRKKQLNAKALEIIAQEARHLASTADYDQVSEGDEEDDYLREQLIKWADILSLTSKSSKRAAK